eukprot:CAMPEP_0206267486 /NCGR_PEP_ID=MMETSP0047_2-20121206/31177_1 /ASSEMBLY_ACC=CAM_ASM_000192 /TAXON_ID=195065 /ORGANISM="Chroomonas mesostigmatica_cf, Strain CCMP1168" /LENGTH=286 /DNA_ID=CAMNT_0053695697 /DNA_START=62 /DNA_END=922 /DNA_ORIENTATION=-
MTAHVIIKLAEMDEGVLDELVTVSERASGIIGTSAKLREGDTIRVLDCLYAMMLPSGNDAACALAEHFGARMHVRRAQSRGAKLAGGARESALRSLGICLLSDQDAHSYLKKLRSSGLDGMKAFVQDMNWTAVSLGLSQTFFVNPHGLNSKNHLSTAEEMARLALEAMKNELFRQIVITKKHSARVHNVKEGTSRVMSWQNTNVLLGEEGYEGIKTGNTPTAKYCLASQYRDKESGNAIISVVLASQTKDKRSQDTRNLASRMFPPISNGIDLFSDIRRLSSYDEM